MSHLESKQSLEQNLFCCISAKDLMLIQKIYIKGDEELLTLYYNV